MLKSESLTVYPAFILTSYKFSNFCNRKNQPPPGDKNLSDRKGEHDIVIIHYKYGMFFIEVKAGREDTKHKQVQEAKRQLSKAVDFFDDNFKTFKGTKSTFIALPNIKKKSLPRCDGLFDDHLPCYSESQGAESKRTEERLRSWWTKQTSTCTGFASFAEYRRVVAKYIGWKSTVKVPMFGSIRSPGDVVARMGNRYMNITLTPQQIYILNNHLPRLVIRGEYGSGKTTMLILKARQRMMAHKVCIINMARSPLLQVLDDSVMHGMDSTKGINNVSRRQVGNHLELRETLKICAEARQDVFIDEVPSSLENDESLKESINSYPEDCWIWAIMSCQRRDDMKESLKEIFSCFQIAVLNKVLRCPPSIFPGCKTIQQPGETFPLEESKVNVFFKSHGLEPKCTPMADSKQWSDFTIVDGMTQEVNIIHWLKQLDCKVDTIFNMAGYTAELLSEKLRGMEMIILTNRIHPNYVLSHTRIPIKGGGDIYVKEDHGLETIVSKKQLKYLLGKVENDRQGNTEDAKVIIDAKSYVYHFFENLGYPLITQDDPALIGKNCILWTSESDLAGFERKMVLRISENKVHVNQELQRIEGPESLTVNHSGHTGQVQECKPCQDQLNGIFGKLGLVKISVEHHENRPNSLLDQPSNNDNEQRSQNVIAQHKNPRLKLRLCDVVVLDDRQLKHDVINLLHKINIPPEVSPYGYEDRVVYTTPDMFRGLEKKVVLVITDNECTDLAVSRCSSQLIVLKTNSDPSSTSAAQDHVWLTALKIILLLVLCIWSLFLLLHSDSVNIPSYLHV